VATPCLVDIVGELTTHGDGDVDVSERTSGIRRTGGDLVEEDRCALAQERVADPAVGERTGEAQVGGPERGDVDRDVHRFGSGPDRRTLATGQR
jgi:hypothetical protein